MKRNLTAEICLARAGRLTVMADAAKDYETILTYESLAMEWLELAARYRVDARPDPVAAPAPAPRRRRKRFWFL